MARDLVESREAWDREAATFDDEPDHGLRDPATRAAWRDLMAELLGPEEKRVADIGCGTGSVLSLLAEMGHHVTGLDISPAMLKRARAKVGPEVVLVQGDASRPNLPNGEFDTVVCRHVLWALPEPRVVLERWADLLRPGGEIHVIEGIWHTGAGLGADAIRDAMPSVVQWTSTRDLTAHDALWDGPVTDDRFVLTARVA